jgi:tetratricopeptide (TPR) repeat protein
VTEGQDEREAAFQRALKLQRARRHAEAIALFEPLTEPALTLKVAVGLGISLLEVGRFAEAERWLGAAAAARPNEPEVRRLMGNLYAEQGRTAEAEAEYRAALSLRPDFPQGQMALGNLLLSLGRYAEGWPLIEPRVALSPETIPPINVAFPEWRGEPLEGRSILVWYEQGLGDQIQMCRFAQSLKARGAAHVALGCRPQLVDLIATATGVDEVVPVPLGQPVTVKRYDFWSRYFSLPAPLGITLETLPKAPYLSAPADRRARWSGFSGVGLAWRASPTGFNADHKNLPDRFAEQILVQGAVSLHPEDTGVGDFADTAAIMERLDLVISIDTSVAHLAGAMGRPVWTLLPRVHCDWRWLRERTDSPWYPSMRLYRQEQPGDWEPVVSAVLADLAARA